MSQRSCSSGGCASDRIWGLIRPDGKLARFSFSRSVLDWVNQKGLGGTGRIERFKFRTGDTLQPGQESASGIYAIVAEQGSVGRVLRVCYSAEQAELFSLEGARSIAEFWILPQEEASACNMRMAA